MKFVVLSRVIGAVCVISGALISGAALAGSEEDELALIYGDKDSVSIATGSVMPLRLVPAVATVITAEDIKAMGSADLNQVLETVPGLHVSQSQQGNQPIYSIRGIFTLFNAQVLVMVNGVPITHGFLGSRGNLWGGFPLEHVARIEVIRGPGSALYGAEALSGVINIITKSAQEIAGTELGLRSGSFASHDAWVQHGGKLGAMDLAAYLRVGGSDGSEKTIARDGQTLLDGLFGTQASLAPGPISSRYKALDARIDLAWEQWQLRAGHQGRYDVGVGAGLADTLDPEGEADLEDFNLDLTWDAPQLTQNWGVKAQLSYLERVQTVNNLHLFPPGAFGGNFPEGLIGRPDHWERQTRMDLTAQYTGLERHHVRVGTGYHYDDLYQIEERKNFVFVTIPGVGSVPVPLVTGITTATEANGLFFITPQARGSSYVYVQDEWDFAPDWHLTAGVRYDYYDDFGGTTNPRLALVWDTRYDLTSKLLFGRAFRAPSFVELYTINNPVALGNPNLRPETIDMLELAFIWQASPDLRVWLNLFQYQFDDLLIQAANADPATGNTAQNFGSQRGSGLELEASWKVDDQLRLAGNYAYQQATDETTDSDAGNAPQQQLYLRADWRFMPDWHLGGQLNWVADRKRPANDTRPELEDYTTVDLTLRTDRWRAQGWEAAVSVRNLFDVDAFEPTTGAAALNIPGDLPSPGRSAYLELRFQWL